MVSLLSKRKIEKNSYMFIAANNNGGSVVNLMPIGELKIYINKMLADGFSQDPAALIHPHVYFAPLVKRRAMKL